MQRPPRLIPTRLRSRVQPAATKGVRLGDKLLSIDGHSLGGRRIRDVFAEDIAAGQWLNSTNCFNVCCTNIQLAQHHGRVSSG